MPCSRKSALSLLLALACGLAAAARAEEADYPGVSKYSYFSQGLVPATPEFPQKYLLINELRHNSTVGEKGERVVNNGPHFLDSGHEDKMGWETEAGGRES